MGGLSCLRLRLLLLKCCPGLSVARPGAGLETRLDVVISARRVAARGLVGKC